MWRHLIRIISIILLVLTFIQIYKFSDQDGNTSSELSRKAARKIIEIFPYTKTLSIETKEKMVERSQPIIRKLAHFSVYTLVGIFIMSFISTYKVHLKYKFLVSILVGLLYAISDEYHQSLVPGRGPSGFDVIIDTAGVIFGIILVLIIISVFKALTAKDIPENTDNTKELNEIKEELKEIKQEIKNNNTNKNALDTKDTNTNYEIKSETESKNMEEI